MIKQEWSYLARKKMFLLVVAAIIAIPTIYTTLFLGSMWDPYGKMDQLPVAIVNEDQPVTYEKQQLSVGDDLVDKLKENDSLAFNFVNQESADRGLANGTYYMVITIPENFSHNASTLMDSHPEKMELQYDTNPGTNYIASKMSETALLKIRTSVANQVTKTYTETVFDQIEKVGKGMDKAAKGAKKIKTGTGKLSDGSRTITSNLKVLSDSAVTFQKGSASMAEGAADLKEGSNQLKTGVTAADRGASDLSGGLTTLQQQVKPLGSALPSLDTGAGALKGGIDQLNSGSETVLTGAKQINAGLETLDDKSAALTSGAKSVSDGLSHVLDNMGGATANTSSLKQTAKNGASAADNTDRLSGTSSEKLQVELNAAKASGDVDKIAAVAEEAVNATRTNENAIETLSTQLKKTSTTLSGAADTLSNAPTTTGLTETLKQLQQASAAVSSGISEYTSGVHQLSTSSPAFVSGIQSINSGSQQLSAGASELQSGTKKLSDSAPGLIQGVNTLQGGAVKLHQGTSALKAGSSDLYDGTVQAKDGADQLSAGAGKISAGASLLYTGSNELGTGIKQLSDGSYALSSQLAKGAKQVNETSASDETTDMFAYPVSSQETKTTTVENNGHAMAPYMMSVALWVACIAFCLMYPVMKYTGELKSGLRWWGSKASILYLIAVVQAPIMVGALHLFNGFNPEEMAKTVLVAVLASAAFMSILYFFNAWIGKVGSFIMLIFMVVQLAGSAGTYPVELSGSFVPVLHKWLPFTYTVDAFRSTISGGQSILPDIIVLLALFLIFTGLTITIFKFRARRIKAGKRVMNQLLEEKGLM